MTCRFSTILPETTRERSSRSLTRRVRCRDCRSISSACSPSSLPSSSRHLRGQQDRAERIAQLVAEDGQEAVALVDAVFERLHQIADLVLPLARAQRRLRGADEALDAHGPVDERDVRAPPEVAERAALRARDGSPVRMMIGTSDHGGCSSSACASRGVTSGGSASSVSSSAPAPLCELARTARRRRRNASHDEAGRFEVRAHQLRVAPDRRDDQHSPAPVLRAHASRISLTMLSKVGTPVSTPR